MWIGFAAGDLHHLAHQELYGFQVESPVEIVNLRAIGIGQVTDIKPPKMGLESPDASAAMINERPVYFDRKSYSTSVYERNLLKAGNEIAGPALITQTDSTTLIHPDHLAGRMGALGALAAVIGRDRGATGAHVEVAQVEVLMATLADEFLAEAIDPGSVRPRGNSSPDGAPWGTFPCAGEQRWVVICVRDDDDWVGLRRAMGCLLYTSPSPRD